MHLKVCSMHDVWWERGMNISTLSFYVSMAMTQKCVQSIQIVLVYNVDTSISSNRFRYLRYLLLFGLMNIPLSFYKIMSGS